MQLSWGYIFVKWTITEMGNCMQLFQAVPYPRPVEMRFTWYFRCGVVVTLNAMNVLFRLNEEAGGGDQIQFLHGDRQVAQRAGKQEADSAVPAEGGGRTSHGAGRAGGTGGQGQPRSPWHSLISSVGKYS